jgi:hypothetical protein
MSTKANTPPANDVDTSPQTVPEQVLDMFCQALAAQPEYKDVAERFRQEPGRSDEALRRILFGDET